MDVEKLVTISALIEDLLGNGEPSDADLDYDDAAIQVYADLHNLRDSLSMLGIY